MQAIYLTTIDGQQDGAVYDGLCFRYTSHGTASVWDVNTYTKLETYPIDKKDLLFPHNNATIFGSQKYTPTDKYPLLYTNVYNSYKHDINQQNGTLCVYRIIYENDTFTNTLVQVIRIGFTEDLSLWKSLPDGGDVRPFGNFALDIEKNQLVAFVMRDQEKVTRYLTFHLPDVHAGMIDETLGVPVVTLTPRDIITQFDGPYAYYLQGATCHHGILYSLEGFNQSDPVNKPRLQLIDIRNGTWLETIDLWPLGLEREPEMISFDTDDKCYFSDVDGRLFSIIW